MNENAIIVQAQLNMLKNLIDVGPMDNMLVFNDMDIKARLNRIYKAIEKVQDIIDETY